MATQILNLLYRDNSLTRNIELLLASRGGWVTFPELFAQARDNKMAAGVEATDRGLHIAMTRAKNAGVLVSDESGYNWRHAEVTPVEAPVEPPADFNWSKAGPSTKGGWRGKVPSNAGEFYHKALGRNNLNPGVLDKARTLYVEFLTGELPGISAELFHDALLRAESMATEEAVSEVEAEVVVEDEVSVDVDSVTE